MATERMTPEKRAATGTRPRRHVAHQVMDFPLGVSLVKELFLSDPGRRTWRSIRFVHPSRQKLSHRHRIGISRHRRLDVAGNLSLALRWESAAPRQEILPDRFVVLHGLVLIGG